MNHVSFITAAYCIGAGVYFGYFGWTCIHYKKLRLFAETQTEPSRGDHA